MDVLHLILPRWSAVGPTDLTYDEIGQRLDENIVTGFSFYNKKPYYGQFTPQGFVVRKPYGKLKKTSFWPTIEGKYGEHDGQMDVSLVASPHQVFRVAFAVIVCFWALNIVTGIPGDLRTGHAGAIGSGLVSLALLYGAPWLVFRVLCTADLRFWTNALEVRVPPEGPGKRGSERSPRSASREPGPA